MEEKLTFTSAIGSVFRKAIKLLLFLLVIIDCCGFLIFCSRYPPLFILFLGFIAPAAFLTFKSVHQTIQPKFIALAFTFWWSFSIFIVGYLCSGGFSGAIYKLFADNFANGSNTASITLELMNWSGYLWWLYMFVIAKELLERDKKPFSMLFKISSAILILCICGLIVGAGLHRQ